MNYSCDYCNKLYKRKYHFDRHVLACRVISISRGDLEIKCQESADTFTPEETSKLILDLYKRVTDAETRLRQITVAERKKINILDWLNKKEDTPEMPFYEWLHRIVIDNRGLELIFSHDYIEGMLLILEPHLSEENIPIKAFDKKSNQLYIYTDEWILVSAHEFNKFLGTMSKKILVVDISPNYNPSELMLTGEPYIMDYLENIRGDLSGFDEEIIIENHVHTWSLDLDA